MAIPSSVCGVVVFNLPRESGDFGTRGLFGPAELSALFHPLPLSITLSQMLDIVLAPP
jgi:hypothetical protein